MNDMYFIAEDIQYHHGFYGQHNQELQSVRKSKEGNVFYSAYR